MKRWMSVALAGLALVGVSRAQQLPPDVVLPTDKSFANSPDASAFPGSNAAFLSDDVTFRVLPDGSTQYDEHDFIKVFTAAGVEEHKDLLRVYRSDVETVEVVRARTILPDGRYLEIPKSAVVDEPIFEKKEGSVNHTFRRLLVRYPALSPNAILEFHLRTRRKPLPGGKWWAVSYTQNPEPMVSSRFTVEVPTGQFWRYATPGYGELEPQRSREGDFEQARWTIEKSPALQQEPAGPPLVQQMKRLEVSNFSDWNDLRSWFETHFEACAQADPAITAQVKSLGGETASAQQTLELLGGWANKKRFLASSLDEFHPHPAASLLHEEVMTPVDAAVLMAALYRGANFSVQPVLAFELPAGEVQQSLPRFNRADNLLLRVSREGKSWWVDPRHPLEFSPSPPSGLQGGSALMGAAEQPLVALDSGLPEENRVVTDVEARLDERGRLELRFNSQEHGASGAMYREAGRELFESGKDERDRQLKRLFDRIAQGYGSRARVLDHYFNLSPKLGEPVDLAATLALPDFAVRIGDKLALPMPVRINPQLVNLAEVGGPRLHPARVDHPWREDCRLRLHLPSGTRVVELPETIQISSPYGSFFATARSDGKQLHYYSRLVIHEAVIPKEKVGELAEFARQVVRARGRVLLAPNQGTARSPS